MSIAPSSAPLIINARDHRYHFYWEGRILQGMSLLADCPRCGRRELRGASSLHVARTDQGDLLAVTCRRCGATLSAATSRLLAEPLHGVA
jgi:hypothetical protein